MLKLKTFGRLFCVSESLLGRRTFSFTSSHLKDSRGADVIISNPSKRGKGYELEKKEIGDLERAELLNKGLTELGKRHQSFLYEDNELMPVHGSYRYFWKFDSEESVNKWIVSTDRDNKEGMSTAYLRFNKHKKALFYGNLCTAVPKDGQTTKAGYCHMRSPTNKMGKMFRSGYYDFTEFTHLVMRFRGDGRAYLLGFSVDYGLNIFSDLSKMDLYNFALFTRGGPYWQIAKIPLSQFFLTVFGRIQDKQELMNPQFIKTFSIGIMDSIDGPFQLEVDYIALMRDENEDYGASAYEMYDDDQ